jgi:hypothetical protein
MPSTRGAQELGLGPDDPASTTPPNSSSTASRSACATNGVLVCRRDTRRWRNRRGRDAERAHDRPDPAAPARCRTRRPRCSRCAARSTCGATISSATTRASANCRREDAGQSAQRRGREPSGSSIPRWRRSGHCRSSRTARRDVRGFELPPTHGALLDALGRLGLSGLRRTRGRPRCADPGAFHAAMGQKRDALPFDIDGVVYKVNRLALQRARIRHARAALGSRAQVSGTGAMTIVRGIDVQVGRTGGSRRWPSSSRCSSAA